MLKKMILCAAVAMAALVMFSGVASAAITGTPALSTIPHTGTNDWTVTSIDNSYGNGTLEIAGGSLLDMNGHTLALGWGSAGTVTITGAGSKLLTNNSLPLGRNVGEGNLIIEDGGWLENTASGRTVEITQTGPGTVSVTGADSKLTSVNGQLVVGMYTNHIGLMTVEDSGLVQTKELRMGFDGSGCEGYVHMGEGGVLAVDGDKTTNRFLPGGMFTKGGGTAIGEIQYNPSDDGTTWLNMTGATEGVDYTLTYYDSSYIVNGQDLDGYTVLTMPGPSSAVPEPSTFVLFAIGLLGLVMAGRRRKR